MAAGVGGSSIPADLQDISGRLSTDADLLHIHQVCTHWRASTSALVAPRPWIIAGREPWQEVGPIGEYSFWLPHGGRQEFCSGAPAGLSYCCGAPRGWLAMADRARSPRRLVLWEPRPSRKPRSCCPAARRRADFPLRRPARLGGLDGGREPEDPEIPAAAFHHGRAYFIDASWRLRVYDLEASAPRRVRDMSLRPSAKKVFAASGRAWFQVLRTLHAVPCGGECLLVVTYGGHRPVPAEVYRADWEAEPLVEIGERLRDLGEHSLFVGRGDAFALSAREFPAVRKNCVYYVEHDNFWREQRWATVFDLGSKSWERIPYPEDLREDGSGCWQAYSWFCLREPLLKEQYP
ncbi:hypothetical protein BAE44_0016738 [Dichanthelium oligosanthes]|uniref:KIB1-4 beta-propeller domain-containing protein n=1 Tax=Dichanthelium oligosanthes TaxID=888268 RepID=A0A1E5VB01_9POAL|nr:hypothetical protein BAE44_0016738 [Dichanthelium oligosanthes]